ncbi:MAG: UDP-N-acetylmuramoyl-L-alanyl-D-glutamate--2,6-diaminopimelate ligase [Bacteroidota bacterium]
MKLRELLASLHGVVVSGDLEQDVGEVCDDSRQVRPGDVFVAVPGTAADGRVFLADAASRGAAALVSEGAPGSVVGGADFRGAVVTVPDARAALAIIASNRFGTPGALTLCGVTGTNGKTTTTYLMESILAAAGVRAGVVGTIGYRLATALSHPAPLTTPGPLMLHRVFADMRDAGATDVVLEASSHALHQHRLDGCVFAVAGLTNLTQDHLDYHGTMDSYMDAKAILFGSLLDPGRGTAVLPVDLPEGRAMRARVRGRATLGVAATVGTARADVVVDSVSMSASGFRARLSTPSGPLDIRSPLVGDFNLANIVLAVGMAFGRGIAPDAIVAGIERLAGVPGRLERVGNDRGVLCVVDYAHTPDAIDRAIAAVRPLVGPGGRLLTIFGCGGDRDQTKRPLMGQAAARGSDLAIVTSDNPRREDPDAIIEMIVAGVRSVGVPEIATGDWDAAVVRGALARGFLVSADRRAAIRHGVAAARAGDVLLIAGKGHEDYQIVGTTRVHFDDREEAGAAFALPPPAAPPGGSALGGAGPPPSSSHIPSRGLSGA